MRLLSIVTRMNVGGPAMQISTLMRGLAGTAIYQVLLTGNVLADETDYLDVAGSDLRFHRVPNLQRSIRPTQDAKALRTIVRFVHDFDPDIIHTHTAKAGSLGRAAAIATRSRAKRVHTFHGHLLHGYFSPEKTQTIIGIERVLAKRSDRLIAVGHQVKEDLLAEGIGVEGQYRIIPPGLDLEPSPTRAQARVDLGLDGQAKVVSLIGRLTSIKRIDRLVDTIRATAEQALNVVFVVAGDGPEAHRIQSAIELGLPVVQLGWRSDVERILAASDATILTSDNEGTPVSLIQAGLAGVPAIATDVGSVKDVVVDGHSGFLTRPDAASLSNALLRLLEDPQLQDSFKDFSMHYFRQRYSADSLVPSHLNLYRELMAERSP